LVGAAIVFGVVGLIGLIVAPATATILWVVLVAMAPMTFQLSLALIGKRTANHTSALILSGYVNTVGYLFSALGPLVAGLGFWLTGSWTTSLVFLLLVTLLQIPAMWVLSRENVVDDELVSAGR
jgi:CP family cyanate transporter-like MFS transporter